MPAVVSRVTGGDLSLIGGRDRRVRSTPPNGEGMGESSVLWRMGVAFYGKVSIIQLYICTVQRALMEIVIDASVLIAVITNEDEKEKLVAMTEEAELIAPLSVHWEIGNAFSSLLKRKRVTIDEALQAIEIYLQIPVRFVEVELTESLELANELGLYAYDAYLLRCAAKYRLPLLTLDARLIQAAKEKKIQILEVAE